MKSCSQRSVEAYFEYILKALVKYEKKTVSGAVFGRSLKRVRVMG